MNPSVRPSALLDELGIEEPAEIDVEVIAQYCKATVVYESLKGCDARIVGKGDRAYISVEQSAPRSRQRFSVAHELGHWMRDRGKLAAFACADRSFISEWRKDNPETRANRFAAELLLPTALFEVDARGREMTLTTASDLADRYVTSLTATAIRLVELGSFPAMLICSEAGRRKWFVRSRDVHQLWPVEELQPGSVAHDLSKHTLRADAPADVAADLWINHDEAGRYVVREDSRRLGEFLLTLLWWKDERQLADLLNAVED